MMAEITRKAFNSLKYHPMMQVVAALFVGLGLAFLDWYDIEYSVKTNQSETHE